MGLLAEREFSEEGNKAGQGLCGDGNEREGAEGKGEGGCEFNFKLYFKSR